MSSKVKFLKPVFAILILIASVTSCKKDNVTTDYTYYISKESSLSYTKDYITTLLDAASVTMPDFANLKPYVSSGVNCYKVIYKTSAGGQDINASGLVCVPSDPGEYPVLSFQNGTNTVNLFAPTEDPSSYTYQMIEAVASMGYIVVIADYPGFGESSQIPHPYLVKEPTVRSLVDLLYAVKEMITDDLPGISLKNDYSLMGYSQGGWSTLALDKTIETDYSSDFNLTGSVCGAGPYDLSLLFNGMVYQTTYPMPVYIGYIINAYSAYDQFTNPVSDILNEPYAGRLSTLYDGTLTSDQINSQLNDTLSVLLNPSFIAGFNSSNDYASIREALAANSLTAWQTGKPLLLIHGEADSTVSPISTLTMYDDMIQAGTPASLIDKVMIPDVGHGDGAVPAMTQGILYLLNLRNSK
ncbi:MAG TPA: lipase family protein [Bacteroidales bacterium]|nr:lipase family protein [Bacteroidales bacterium]